MRSGHQSECKHALDRASLILSEKSESALALLWQLFALLARLGFTNQFFNDSWVVGFWRADHGGNEVKLGRRSWTLAQTVLGSLGSQGAAADVSALCGW